MTADSTKQARLALGPSSDDKKSGMPIKYDLKK